MDDKAYANGFNAYVARDRITKEISSKIFFMVFVWQSHVKKFQCFTFVERTVSKVSSSKVACSTRARIIAAKVQQKMHIRK